MILVQMMCVKSMTILFHAFYNNVNHDIHFYFINYAIRCYTFN